MSDGNVINLSSGEPVTLIKRKDGFCDTHCKNVLVDAHLRKVTCRECGADIDPFTWVARMASEESHLLTCIHHLNTELDSKSKRLDELKQEENRVKARIRSAKDSLLKSVGV